MLDIFRELRGLLRVSHVHIDSWVFRLHYSVTTTCMFAFSLIGTFFNILNKILEWFQILVIKKDNL